ncbi:hypothetical protein BKA65DRAFT_516019 [Rhexocercosporidium sp. MPI-PUGE-AT-0058]|nr:hypothetical protein BKA65DRAFT_516019 [Rhexocercosporidium sp. MPI-PUGE-AT-0058]
MDQAGVCSSDFNSLDCIYLEPSLFELVAYAEFGISISGADCYEAVTQSSLPSSWDSSEFSFGEASPAANFLSDACMFEEPLECDQESVRPTDEAELYALPLGFRSSPLGSPVRFPPEEPFEQLLRCNYFGCTSVPFQKMCDFKLHLKGHANQVLGNWTSSQPCRCSWPRCPSKALFKSSRMLQTHLENIHVSPLLCSFPNCTHRTPFRSNFDLKRHLRTHSGELGRFHCPYPNCQKDPKIFVRKDKWLNHLRSSHSGDACPLNHCEAGSKGHFQSQAEIVEHIKKFHGNFECGVGSCSSGSRSRFAEFDLLKHLEIVHGMQYSDIGAARNVAKLASDRTVRSKDVPECEDCMCCKKAVKDLGQIASKGGALPPHIR